MITFENHPAGLLLLRFDDGGLETIKALSPQIHDALNDAFVRAQVLKPDNGAKKSLKVTIRPQFLDGRTLVPGQVPGTFELECNGTPKRRVDEAGIRISNLRADVEFDALILTETEASVRETFVSDGSNMTVQEMVVATLEERAMTEDALVVALHAFMPSDVRSVVDRMVACGYIVHGEDGLHYDANAGRDDPEALARTQSARVSAPKAPSGNLTIRRRVRDVFTRHDRETSFSAAAVAKEAGVTVEEALEILKKDVERLRLFREGKGYRLPSHAARSQLANRIAEILAISTTHFREAGLTAAIVKRELKEYAPQWIVHMLNTMVARKQISLQGDLYVFNEPDGANRGSGLNKVRAVLKEAGETGITPRQAIELLPDIKPQFIHYNLQQLAIHGRARFDNDRFYWIGPKPATVTPRVSFPMEVLAFIQNYPEDGVPRDVVMSHFDTVVKTKVSNALNELQNRGYVSLRNSIYRPRESAPVVSNASASATP